MKTEKADYSGYVAIKKQQEEGGVQTVRFSHSREKAEDFSNDDLTDLISFTTEEKSKGDVAECDDAAPDVAAQSPIVRFCSSLMHRFDRAISPFHGLVEIGTFMRPAFTWSQMERTVLALVRSSGTKLQDDENVETYGLPLAVASEVNKHIDRIKETDEGLSLLPSSILLSLVATFDSIIAETFGELIKFNPVQLFSGERQITYKELFESGDVEKIKLRIIEAEVDRLMRGSHEAQVEYLEKLTDTKIAGHYARMPNFLEIFERRNQVAHASGMITNQYIDKCARFKYDVSNMVCGEKLDLRPRYLHKSIDILLEFGILLSFVAWRKLSGDEAEDELAYTSLNDVCLEFIKRRRFNLAIWLLEFALFRQTRVKEESITRNMVLNLANAYKKINKKENMEQALSSMNWSAISDIYRIGLASLREDVKEVARLLPILEMTKALSKRSFREWPIFDWVRDDPEVAKVFEEVFKEPLVLGVVETPVDGSREARELTAPDATRH